MGHKLAKQWVPWGRRCQIAGIILPNETVRDPLRRAEALAGGLVAQEAAALVGAARLAREPDSARVEGVGPEVVEARVQVGEGGLRECQSLTDMLAVCA